MSTYIMSDLHGNYEAFQVILKKIKLKKEDSLYILGDIIDRGNHPIQIILDLMKMDHVHCLMGNHELMAISCLDYLMKEITEDSIAAFDERKQLDLLLWIQNGGDSTMYEFLDLDRITQYEVIDYISSFKPYELLYINNKKYILVHAGLGDFNLKKSLDDYSIEQLVWERSDYQAYFDEHTYIISGHTPTQLIENNPRPGFIYKNNNHIAIDCGAGSKSGRLSCICLETMEEFYSDE